jgi:enoyl-CoA hydratase/carnithine racemase
VRYEQRDGIGVITLDRPDNRNSMTPELLDAFARAAAQARGDGALRCLVVTGTGSCFSAGADFRSQVQRDGEGRGQLPHERSYAMYQPFLSLLDIEVPIIAALNGHAVGGGFGLALVCDLRIAASGARYGANFARLGLHPGMAITYLLPRLVGVARAAELLFTGALISGEEAAAIGLVRCALPAEQVLPEALSLAQSIASNAPLAVRATKRTLYELLDWAPRRAALHEALLQAESLQTEDAAEGMGALLEKRPPVFRGR